MPDPRTSALRHRPPPIVVVIQIALWNSGSEDCFLLWQRARVTRVHDTNIPE